MQELIKLAKQAIRDQDYRAAAQVRIKSALFSKEELLQSRESDQDSETSAQYRVNQYDVDGDEEDWNVNNVFRGRWEPIPMEYCGRRGCHELDALKLEYMISEIFGDDAVINDSGDFGEDIVEIENKDTGWPLGQLEFKFPK